MGVREYNESKRKAGILGGKISGLKRKWRQEAVIRFILNVEREEGYLFSQTLVQRLAFRLCGKTINSGILVANFRSERDASNKLKVSTIVDELCSQYDDVFKTYWENSEGALDYEVEALRKLLV